MKLTEKLWTIYKHRRMGTIVVPMLILMHPGTYQNLIREQYLNGSKQVQRELMNRRFEGIEIIRSVDIEENEFRII